MNKSAGIVPFRRKSGSIEILLGHMGGPFWAKRDEGAWTIPKGLIEAGEDPLQAALRECEEEFGFSPEGDPIDLGEIRQKGGKKVMAWAIECDSDPIDHKSNVFTIEWPPRSGKLQQFPEIDRVQWFTVDQAAAKAVEGQAEFFRILERKLR